MAAVVITLVCPGVNLAHFVRLFVRMVAHSFSCPNDNPANNLTQSEYNRDKHKEKKSVTVITILLHGGILSLIMSLLHVPCKITEPRVYGSFSSQQECSRSQFGLLKYRAQVFNNCLN